MAQLSIILPVPGNPAQMEDTLVSVLANRPAECEILVVLNQAYDDPYDLAGEVSFHRAVGRRWTGMVNLALAASQAPIVHVLRCGTVVQEGWADAALARFDDPSVGAVVPLVLRAEEPDRIASAGWRFGAGGALRPLCAGGSVDTACLSACTVDACDLASTFFRRTALETIGGVHLDVSDRLAGADTALALRQAGYRCLLDPTSRVLAKAEPEMGAFRRGWEEEQLFWRWAPASGWAGALVHHAITVTGEAMGRCVRPLAMLGGLAGRLAATLTALGHRRHWENVQRWSEVVPRTAVPKATGQQSRRLAA